MSDGTVAGTRLVKDINPGTGSGASAIAGAAFKNKIWFQGKTPESGTELWCSDGQENGTKMIETAAGFSGMKFFTSQGQKIEERDMLSTILVKQ